MEQVFSDVFWEINMEVYATFIVKLQNQATKLVI